MLIPFVLTNDLGLLAHRIRVLRVDVLHHAVHLALQLELAAGREVEAGGVDDGK